MKRGLETSLLFLLPLAVLLLGASTAYCECPQADGDEIRGWISSIRGTTGLGPLETDPILEQVAGEYALELARRGVLSHRDTKGGDALDRTQLAGGTATLIGEILGSGPGPAEVAAGWAASEIHRSVVENALWTHLGVGCTVLGSRQVWVVLFAARRIRSLRIEALGGPQAGSTDRLSGGSEGAEAEGGEAAGVPSAGVPSARAASARAGSARAEPAPGYQVSGRLPSGTGLQPLLLSGVRIVEPELWLPETGEFLYRLPPRVRELYHRLGYRDAEGRVTITDAFYPARAATSFRETGPR
jgi:hypothetical protein